MTPLHLCISIARRKILCPNKPDIETPHYLGQQIVLSVTRYFVSLHLRRTIIGIVVYIALG